MCRPLVDYFRCPESMVLLHVESNAPGHQQYFRLGQDTICYGSLDGGPHTDRPGEGPDALAKIRLGGSTVLLPFDPAQVIDNLRLELYPVAANSRSALSQPQAIRSLYYVLRPLLPVAIRKWAQRAYLSDWQSLSFPSWPVDFTVERILEHLLLQTIQAQGLDSIPFIWFWPNGKKGCVLITHDVETRTGRNFTSHVMDMDDEYGIRSSFQVIPRNRYEVPRSYISEIKDRGFEVNVHDLTHDGSLFRDHESFLRQASEINQVAAEWGAAGFRSGALYRRQQSFETLRFEYDMSVPNVAALEPQRGGCCTVFPYFIGDILEIPLTAAQDYSLFNILNDYSTQVWQRQLDLIYERHGLASFIVHPDYIVEERPRRTYRQLLALLDQLREPRALWIALPGDVNRWWRARSESRVVKSGSEWVIEGPAKQDACLAYARVEGDRLVFDIAPPEQSLHSHRGADAA